MNILEDPTDNELLLATCSNDQDDVLTTLLTTGDYDTNFTDKLGNTALHYAAKTGSLNCLELLLRVPDLEIDLQNKDGDTALHIAARYEDDLDIAFDMVDLIFGACANGRIKNNAGATAQECLYPKHHEINEIFDLVEFNIRETRNENPPVVRKSDTEDSDDDFGFFDEEYDDND
ncbi:ankyrin repeat-containing domain protein [Sporodiniella umbellata]|nr:ankyrin repeat-containing domain protein [Sporodiniella umbellata]